MGQAGSRVRVLHADPQQPGRPQVPLFLIQTSVSLLEACLIVPHPYNLQLPALMAPYSLTSGHATLRPASLRQNRGQCTRKSLPARHLLHVRPLLGSGSMTTCVTNVCFPIEYVASNGQSWAHSRCSKQFNAWRLTPGQLPTQGAAPLPPP